MSDSAPTRLSRRTVVRAASVVGGAALINFPVSALAQATPGATPAASPAASPAPTTAAPAAQITELMARDFDEFPPAPMTVRMLRIVVEPGASTPMHTHPGPEFDRIEVGELAVESDGTAFVTRADGSEEELTDAEGTLGQGDAIVFPAGVGMYYINNTEDNVTILSAVLLPVGPDFDESITYLDGQPAADAFQGVSYKVLGDGLIQNMPAGGAVVTIRDIVMPAGSPLPAADGVAMYSEVEGNFSFSVDSGSVQVSRSAQETLQPKAILGQQFTLDVGDAAFFPAGVTETSRADETGTLRILALAIAFDSPIDEKPASLTFVAGEAPATAAEPTATPTQTPRTVTITAEGVNIRAEPSVDAEVVVQVDTGTELTVLGGPEEAEDYTWYNVALVDDPSVSGWVADDFLEGLEATPTPTPTQAATPAADGSAAATPIAASASFQVGDIVETTEPDVRLRAEPTVDSEAVDAFAIGTRFEVTGESIPGDDYVWVPVSLAESPNIAGYMPAQWLRKVS